MPKWNELDDKGKAAALAELLGWVEETLQSPGWRLPDGRWIDQESYSPLTTWEGMGLVVEAMGEKGWDFSFNKNTLSSVAQGFFGRYDSEGHYKSYHGLNESGNLAAAVAEAAYKALEGNDATDS